MKNDWPAILKESVKDEYMSTWFVEEGDSLEILRKLPDACIDAVVTDPPYGLSFMGKRWDYNVPSVEVWQECLRVLKPGGHLLAFAGTRTQHRMCVRIEDAGFEIRDMIAWIYGSGFPKSHNLKDDWQGWGTALKPALEPITVARKPLVGTVAENVTTWGTGAINVDGCRVALNDEKNPSIQRRKSATPVNNVWADRRSPETYASERPSEAIGRWPANLIHDGSDEVTGLFPDSNGSGASRTLNRGLRGEDDGWGMANPASQLRDAGSGSAARFFYCAKANKRDRDEGLDGHTVKTPGEKTDRNEGTAEISPYAGSRVPSKNNHPTVKPTDLMRYLCRLVTPPNGVVLDPFMGSGSTGKAALLEGFRFIGIDREPEYVEIARARLAHADASAA